MISCAGTFARLSNMRKYILLLAFMITSGLFKYSAWKVQSNQLERALYK